MLQAMLVSPIEAAAEMEQEGGGEEGEVEGEEEEGVVVCGGAVKMARDDEGSGYTVITVCGCE